MSTGRVLLTVICVGLGVVLVTAALAGAEIVHTTVNAIGERSGNAALEEVAATLEVLYGVKTEVNFQRFRELSKLVENVSRIPMPPHKPIVGDNAFTTESGIIAGWWARAKDVKPLEVFPFNPNFLGFDKVEISLGKGSGKASIIYRMKELGLTIPPDEEIYTILEKVKVLAEEKKRLLTDNEFIAIVQKHE